MAPISGYGMNPGAVYSAGRGVSGLSGDASAATTKFLSALSEAAGSAHHGKLVSSLNSYKTEWAKPAHQLPTKVKAVGNDISSVGSTGQSTDDTAHAELSPALRSSGSAQGMISRSITAN